MLSFQLIVPIICKCGRQVGGYLSAVIGGSLMETLGVSWKYVLSLNEF